MEKVIYNNMYKRVAENVNEMEDMLQVLFGFAPSKFASEEFEEHVEELFEELKANRQKIQGYIK